MSDRTEALDKLLNDLEPTDPEMRIRYEAILDAGLAELKPGAASCGTSSSERRG